MESSNILFLIAVFSLLLAGSLAGDFCGDSYNYCTYGCCGYNDRQCCTGSVALIVGVCVGSIGFLIVLIVAVCVCCRQSQGRVMYSSQPQPAIVAQSGTSNNQTGMVSTVGGNSGLVCNPHQPGSNFNSYQAYPLNSPYSSGYPSYPMQPQPFTAYATEPPPYDTVVNRGEGVHNAGFSGKN